MLVTLPETMYKVSIVTLRRYSTKLVEEAARAGALHVSKVKKLGPRDVTRLREELSKCEAALSRVRIIFRYLKRPMVVEVEGALTPEDAFRIVDSVSSKVDDIVTRIENLQHELSRLERFLKYFEVLAKHTPKTPVSMLCYRGALYSIVTVAYKPQMRDSFESVVERFGGKLLKQYATPEFTLAIVLVKTRELDKFVEALERVECEVLRVEKKDVRVEAYVSELRNRVSELRSRISELSKDLERVISERLKDLALAMQVIESHAAMIRALLNSGETDYAVVVDGWVPESALDKFMKRIRSALPVCYISYRVADPSEMPPTKTRNPKYARPFEVVVKSFGIPKYIEYDPTPAVAASFILFFSLMNPDIAYGILVALGVKYLLDRFVEDPESPSYKQFKTAMYMLAAGMIVMGALSGTFAGISLPWYGSLPILHEISKAMQDPFTLIKLSVIIGLVHVNLAHAIALIKALKIDKNLWSAVREAGLFVAEAGGIPYVMAKFLRIPVVPPQYLDLMLYIALVGVALIVVSQIKINGGLGAVFWLFDITGLLGDVLSYTRIAGLSLATLYVARSFNMILLMTFKGAIATFGPLGYLSLVAIIPLAFLAHIMNTVFSAMSGFAHSMRLCLVEFASKFFEGEGYEYDPLAIRVRRRVYIYPM